MISFLLTGMAVTVCYIDKGEE